jgi:hypothetical protein
MAELQISVAFDIMDNRPHKAVRLYTSTGMALGYGEVQINKVPESGDLFEKTPGSIIYLVDMNMETLAAIFNKAINGNNISKTKEEIKSDIDVPDTDDPAEDEWVRKSLYQLKEAKCKIDLLTVSNLRNDYKEMIAKKKANEKNNSHKVVEIEIPLEEYHILNTVKVTLDNAEDEYVKDALRKDLGRILTYAQIRDIIKSKRDEYRRNQLVKNKQLESQKRIDDMVKAADVPADPVFNLDKVWDFPEKKKEEPPKTQSLDDLLRNL